MVETFPENVSHSAEDGVATIIDVAERAGVAVTTVSRVMNNKGQVREETRRRVLAAIEELNYRPSPAARGLPRRRVHTVAVVVPFVTHPSAVARVQGIVQGFRDLDMPVSIFDVETPQHEVEHFAMLASGYHPEGAVIVSLRPSKDQLDSFRDVGLCPVFLDLNVDGFSSVFIDDYAGGLMATQHLIDLGHERIAFIGDAEGQGFGFDSSTNRRLGYRGALESAGNKWRTEYERVGEHGRSASHVLTGELLELREPPTAIFASSDTQAMGILEAARDLGLAIPHQISVIGFDDIESARYIGLTTVSQPLIESGQAAAELVREHIDDPLCKPTQVQMGLEIVVRDSTAPPGS